MPVSYLTLSYKLDDAGSRELVVNFGGVRIFEGDLRPT